MELLLKRHNLGLGKWFDIYLCIPPLSQFGNNYGLRNFKSRDIFQEVQMRNTMLEIEHSMIKFRRANVLGN